MKTTKQHVHSARQTLGALCIPLALFCASCSLFEPREAEPPTQSGANYLPRTDALNVIENLKIAITRQDPVGYITCFSDSTRTGNSYRFIPSPAAQSAYGLFWDNWTYDSERAYFQNLVAKKQETGFALLQFGQTPVSRDNGDGTWTYSNSYDFTFQHTDTLFAKNAEGILVFTLTRVNSEWSITRWEDGESVARDTTWSVFKWKFGN